MPLFQNGLGLLKSARVGDRRQVDSDALSVAERVAVFELPRIIPDHLRAASVQMLDRRQFRLHLPDTREEFLLSLGRNPRPITGCGLPVLWQVI